MKEFTIVILNYRDSSVSVFQRQMRADIQSDEVEEMLVKEYNYNSDCYFMFGEKIHVDVNLA